MTHKRLEAETYARQIQETLGPGNRCLGKASRLNFVQDELRSFLQNLSNGDSIKLNKSIAFFRLNMEAIYPLLEERNAHAVLTENVWARLATTLMFSVLDFVIPFEKRKDFTIFLIENFQDIKIPEDIQRLSLEHRKANPPSTVAKITKLFDKHLSSSQKAEIIRNYMPDARAKRNFTITDLQDVIQHLQNDVRSNFLHAIGIEAPYTEPAIFSGIGTQEDPLVIHGNLTPSRFMELAWIAIFKEFGFSGNITTNFSKEEIKTFLAK